MEIYKIIGVALAGVVLVMVVRPVQPQVAVLLSLATGVALLWMTLSQLETVVGFLRELAEGSGLSGGFLGVGLKVTGIAILTDFAVQACQDAGEKGIAGKVELAGKVIMLLVALPMLAGVIEILRKLAPS